MSIIPMLRSREVIGVLLKVGFKVVRQSGSHVRLRHILNPARQTTIPIHNPDIPRSILLKILKQASISIKEFLGLLKK